MNVVALIYMFVSICDNFVTLIRSDPEYYVLLTQSGFQQSKFYAKKAGIVPAKQTWKKLFSFRDP